MLLELNFTFLNFEEKYVICLILLKFFSNSLLLLFEFEFSSIISIKLIIDLDNLMLSSNVSIIRVLFPFSPLCVKEIY